MKAYLRTCAACGETKMMESWQAFCDRCRVIWKEDISYGLHKRNRLRDMMHDREKQKNNNKAINSQTLLF